MPGGKGFGKDVLEHVLGLGLVKKKPDASGVSALGGAAGNVVSLSKKHS